MRIKPYIKLARLHQWVKNILVFAALIFANKLSSPEAWFWALYAFFSFGFVASSMYILNDLFDRKSDVHHPIKKHRPIASGEVSFVEAVILSSVFAAAGMGMGCVNLRFLLVLVFYVVLQVLYNLLLKHKMLADVICIAIGFIPRAIAGAIIINVAISEWLIICTFSLCLFFGFCKRHHEIITLGETPGKVHRKTLMGYTPALLTHLITLSAALAIITFLLYSTSPQTIAKFHTNAFIYTLPVIIYCICRAAMLSMKGAYSGTTEMILKDMGLLAGCILWAIMVVVIILFAEQINFIAVPT